MKKIFVLLLLPIFFSYAFAQGSQQLPTEKGTLLVNISTEPIEPKPRQLAKLNIDFINPQTNAIQEHIDYRVTVTKEEAAVFGPIPLTHTSTGTVTIPVEFKESGEHKITIDVEGILFQPIPPESVTFTTMIGASAQTNGDSPSNGDNGGCLIATAAFGSELAPQVQLLREVRDNVVFGTESGTTFMTAFNAIYYSFSPAIADLERQNPAFKEAVKFAITPMLSTLSILNYVDVDSESEMLGYGIGIMMLNVGIYFVAPALVILKLRRLRF